MPVIRISVDDLARTVQKDGEAALQRAVKAIQTTVRLKGPREINEAIQATVPSPTDRGTYRRAWVTQDTERGAVLYNPLLYAAVLEHGRRPGKGVSKEGQALLAEWVVRKGLIQGMKSVTRYRRATGQEAGNPSVGDQTRARQVKRLVFLIARKMKRKGLPGKKILQKAHARLLPQVIEAARAALGRR